MRHDSSITPEQLPLHEGVALIASNADGLVALDKPIGAMSHPNGPDDRHRALLNANYDFEKECYYWADTDGTEQRVWLINRLDSPTSGVILLALDYELAVEIKQQFATHRVSKTYYALVKRAPSVPSGVWSDTLKKDIHNGKRVIKGGKRVRAKTRYQVVQTPTGGFPVALLRLMPVTGRTHQLRIQCQNHGHPIVGDRTYGSFSFNREVVSHTGEKRMMLHSASTSLHYAFHGKAREFHAESPLPEAFGAVMRYRPGLRQSQSGSAPRHLSGSLAARRFKH